MNSVKHTHGSRLVVAQLQERRRILRGGGRWHIQTAKVNGRWSFRYKEAAAKLWSVWFEAKDRDDAEAQANRCCQ